MVWQTCAGKIQNGDFFVKYMSQEIYPFYNSCIVVFVPAGAKDLIGRLLVVDRRKRFTAIEVLCHPWTISSGGALSVPEKIDEYRHNLRKELETTANKALVSWQKRHN